MFNEIKNLTDFITALENNNELSFSKSGNWNYDTISFFKKDRLPFAKAFNEWFEQLESIPVKFSKDPRFPVEQELDFHAYIDLAEKVVGYLKKTPSKYVNREVGRLTFNILALKYRLEVENGGFDRVYANYKQLEKLFRLATYWKKKQKIFWESHLTTPNIQQLFIACFYPHFIEQLLNNAHHRNYFFRWTIRDNLDPNPFIQFPAFHNRIRAANLHGRLARFGGNLMKVQKMDNEENNGFQKILTLPIQGKDTSILDLNKVIEFRGKYLLTIREILQIFEEKRYKIGNLEFLPGEGIINWNSYCLGWWSAEEKKYIVIDVNKEEWWLQLPYVDVIDQEAIKLRYPLEEGEFVSGMWILSARASREYANLSFQKTHAYLEIAMPLKNGNYSIYNFGKFATKYPRTVWQSIKMISIAVTAAIAYPDENIFYSHRQHVGHNFLLTPEQGLKCLASIREDILLAREDNIIFQIQTDNCSKWIQGIITEQFPEKEAPNLFEVDFLETQAQHGVEAKIFAAIKNFPRYVRWGILRFIHFILGGWKGRYIKDKSGKMVWTSLYRSKWWQDARVYLPSLLHKKHEEKTKHLRQEIEHPVKSYIEKEIKSQLNENRHDPFKQLDIFEESEEKNKTA